MKRKTILAGGVALLLTGCLLASCGKDTITESEPERTEEGSPAETASSAESIAEEITSEETTTAEASAETTSEETSEPAPEPPTEPFVATPMPEGLPGIDSPAPPENTGFYLPAKGWFETHLVDLVPCALTFTYGENSMVVEERGDYGIYTRVEYRFDDQARLAEVIRDNRKAQRDDSMYRTVYTYDGAGRLTGWVRVRESEEGGEEDARADYAYDEDGRLSECTESFLSGGDYRYRWSYTYERTYDENGAVATLEETERYSDEIQSTVRHYYEDGREVLRQTYGGDGELYTASTFTYDENDNLTGERHRSGANAYTDSCFYEEGRLVEIRRDEGKGAKPALLRAYDGYGRLTAAIDYGNDGYYEVYSYAKNGSLSEVAAYYYDEKDGEFNRVLDLAVTAWGDKAVTEMQLAFYRTAMAHLLGGWTEQGPQFSAVEEPKP